MLTAVPSHEWVLAEVVACFGSKEPGPFPERYLDRGTHSSLLMAFPGTGNKGVPSTEVAGKHLHHSVPLCTFVTRDPCTATMQGFPMPSWHIARISCRCAPAHIDAKRPRRFCIDMGRRGEPDSFPLCRVPRVSQIRIVSWLRLGLLRPRRVAAVELPSRSHVLPGHRPCPVPAPARLCRPPARPGGLQERLRVRRLRTSWRGAHARLHTRAVAARPSGDFREGGAAGTGDGRAGGAAGVVVEPAPGPPGLRRRR
jgi:hypothetical protein